MPSSANHSLLLPPGLSFCLPHSSTHSPPTSLFWHLAFSSNMKVVSNVCHGMTSLLSFLIFVCALPHLHHLLTPSNLVCLPPTHVHLPSTASTPTPLGTHATMLHPHSD